ncbi:hypothetical protein QMA04_12035 [Planococcus sp. APC 3900]|uniref:hypothetical protein n=1 Tax=Planococcus sp. APC 3900 TaxID=3035191 RepID=UPI0025B53A02|nr:hypothetical protein [Planococcus sp. APC 3900]MDN3438828.1 hypothetical protein [Planococcus sp. APC 3900]
MKAIWFLALVFLLSACQGDATPQISASPDENSEDTQYQAETEISGTITEIEGDKVLVELSQQISANETVMWIRVNDKTVITDFQETPLTGDQLTVQGEIKAILGDTCAESIPRICSVNKLYLRANN